VRRLRDRGDDQVLTLARPLATIKVKEILELAPPARRAATFELLRDLHDSELDRVGDLTLEDLVRRDAGGPSEPARPPVA
jgi:hypothetical protein